ncbi:unnamed protein product, partial [Symbiodinium sp. CCMP2592]
MRTRLSLRCFDETANSEPPVFVLRRRSRNEAARKFQASNAHKKMKLEHYSNRQFTDHISMQNGYVEENAAENATKRWIWTVPDEASLQSMGIITMPANDPMRFASAAAFGSGLDHDCSTWDELYDDDDGEHANAWNGPVSSTAAMASKKPMGMSSTGSATVLSQ